VPGTGPRWGGEGNEWHERASGAGQREGKGGRGEGGKEVLL